MVFKRIALALLLSSCALQAESKATPPVKEQAVDMGKFNLWLDSFRQKALDSGITRKTVDSALADVKPNEKAITLDRKQPEHKQTKEEYLANVINQKRVTKGRALLAENRELLNNISASTGVEPEFIVALWGLESGYGENAGGFSTINALATLAYEGRRRDFFESELMAALLIVDQGKASESQLRGSWAGAMGQCQFMPSSYLAYGVDYDGDGKIDLWTDREDVFASIANYLSTVGWKSDEESKRLALMHWNRSTYFVASVFKLAESIKTQQSASNR